MISVIIPCRNERSHINHCMDNVFAFDPPESGYEVIVVDGMSDDGTREALETIKASKYPTLTVIENPFATVPHGMNLGILRARGEIIVRTDVRCVHPKDYLVELLKLLDRTGADNVGGVLVPAGKTYTQKSIAAAYGSRIAMGGALRNRGDFEGETDAVYGGCFRKQRLIEVGMYDTSMVRNQDDELSFRLKKNGGKIVQSGKIKVTYYPRERFALLSKQFLQYGYWKVKVLSKHPKQGSYRHYAPSLLVVGLFLLCLASLFSEPACFGLLICVGGYLVAVLAESVRQVLREDIRLAPGVTFAIVTIHASFGVGFLIGLACHALGLKPKYFETLSR